LNLASLIELKLASGISSAERIKDLADVQELIKLLNLPQEFDNSLNIYVQSKYRELWRNVNAGPKRYLALWRGPSPNPEAADLPDAMRNDGVQLERQGEKVYLVTTHPEIARKYDMHDEAEFLEDF
jgi:hypothetical protein